jgi:hypothetical protein
MAVVAEAMQMQKGHDQPAGLRRLIASGAVSWSGGKPRHKLPAQLTSRGASVSQMVLEDRR